MAKQFYTEDTQVQTVKLLDGATGSLGALSGTISSLIPQVTFRRGIIGLDGHFCMHGCREICRRELCYIINGRLVFFFRVFTCSKSSFL